MRYRPIKIIILVFIALICAMFAIGAKYYVKTQQTFKTFEKETNVRMVSMQNSYEQVKQQLDLKYSEKLNDLIKKTNKAFNDKISGVLGVEYTLLKEEYSTIKKSIDSKKEAYFNTEEYLQAKQELSLIKDKLDNLPDAEKDNYLTEFNSALSNISTLNTKLNNQLKQDREKLDLIKQDIFKLFVKNKKELLSLRVEMMKSSTKEIKTLTSEYFAELKALMETYNIEDKNQNFPFDFKNLDKITGADSITSECFNYVLTENSDNLAVFSENNCHIKS